MKNVLVVAVLASTIVSLIGDFGGLRITAIGWAVPLVVSIGGLLLHPTHPVTRLAIWFPWVLFLFFSASISEHANAFHRSVIMITPILVGTLAASLDIRPDDIRRFVCVSTIFATLGVLVVVMKVIGGGQGQQYFLAAESGAMVVFAWIFIHAFIFYRRRAILLVWLLVLAVPLVSVSRAASVAALSCLVLMFAPVGWGYRLKAAAAALVLAIGIVLTPAFQEKTIIGDTDSATLMVQPEAIQTSGRLVAWGILADEVPQALWFGHGSNSSQTVLGNKIDSFDHPHNDWLRILFEYGVTGLVLFLATALGQMYLLLRLAKKSALREVKFACYAASSLFVPFFLLMFTDNVLLFAAYFGNIHFLLIGLACAASTAERKAMARNAAAI